MNDKAKLEEITYTIHQCCSDILRLTLYIAFKGKMSVNRKEDIIWHAEKIKSAIESLKE